jgi:hypothetical protein
VVSFGKKSKKESTASEAAVSSIPVPPAENALVIDLPEGQKLVLGKMEDGTVIEVATWRGTGRPDSRTNRLMLGVSGGSTPASSNDVPPSEESTPTVAARVRQLLLSTLRTSIRLVSISSRRVMSKVSSVISKRRIPTSHLQDQPRIAKEPLVGGTEGFEFEKWLQTVQLEIPASGEKASSPSSSKSGRSRTERIEGGGRSTTSVRRKKPLNKPRTKK